MLSSFSDSAPFEVKASIAFLLYDFDEDNYIGPYDLVRGIKTNVGNRLSLDELRFITQKVFEEADIDGDHRISETELTKILSHIPDFLTTFRIKLL